MDFLDFLTFIPEDSRDTAFLLFIFICYKGLDLYLKKQKTSSDIKVNEETQYLQGIINANKELREMNEFQVNKIDEYEAKISELEQRLNEILSNTKDNENKLLEHEKTIQNLTAERAAKDVIIQKLRYENKELKENC